VSQVTREGLIDKGIDEQTTWIKAALLLIPGMTSEDIDDILPLLMEQHQQVSTRMASHLSLTALNISRSTWMSAAMLDLDPAAAQCGARQFHDHLVRLSAQAASPYERAWLEDEEMMAQLAAFAAAEPPCLLWRKQGAFKGMFVFLADRFLGCPDSVLDCEGVHAKWKWVEHVRRAIAFPGLNAVLRLNDHLLQHQRLPDYEVLRPHMAALVAESRQQYEELRRTGDVARGMRSRRQGPAETLAFD